MPYLTPEEEQLLAEQQMQQQPVQEPPQNYIPGSTYVAPTGVPVEPVQGGGEPVPEPLVPAGTPAPPTSQVAYPTATGSTQPGTGSRSTEYLDPSYGQQVAVAEPTSPPPATSDQYYTGGGASTYYGGPSGQSQPYGTGQTTTLYPAASVAWDQPVAEPGSDPYGAYGAAETVPAQGQNNWSLLDGGVASAGDRTADKGIGGGVVSPGTTWEPFIRPGLVTGKSGNPNTASGSQYYGENGIRNFGPGYADPATAAPVWPTSPPPPPRYDPLSSAYPVPEPDPFVLDAERARQRRAEEERIAETITTPTPDDASTAGEDALGALASDRAHEVVDYLKTLPATAMDVFFPQQPGVSRAAQTAVDAVTQDTTTEAGRLSKEAQDRVIDPLAEGIANEIGLNSRDLIQASMRGAPANTVSPRNTLPERYDTLESSMFVPEPGRLEKTTDTPAQVTRMGLPELPDLTQAPDWIKRNVLDPLAANSQDDTIFGIDTTPEPRTRTSTSTGRGGRAGAIEPGTYPSTPDSMSTQDISNLMSGNADTFKAVTEYGSVTLPDGTVKGIVKIKGADHPERGPLIVGVLQGGNVVPVGNDVSDEQFMTLLQGANPYVDPGTVPEPATGDPLTQVFEGTTTSTGAGTSTQNASGGTTVPPWTGDSGSTSGSRRSSGGGSGGSWDNDSDWNGGYRSGRSGGSSRSQTWGDEAFAGREFTADDFMDAADGDRKKAELMARAANRKRRGKRGKSSSSSMFGDGFPFTRANTPMRDYILTAIAESKSKGKGKKVA